MCIAEQHSRNSVSVHQSINFTMARIWSRKQQIALGSPNERNYGSGRSVPLLPQRTVGFVCIQNIQEFNLLVRNTVLWNMVKPKKMQHSPGQLQQQEGRVLVHPIGNILSPPLSDYKLERKKELCKIHQKALLYSSDCEIACSFLTGSYNTPQFSLNHVFQGGSDTCSALLILL